MKTRLFVAILVLLVTGCQFGAGRFKHLQKDTPPGLIDVGAEVEGENCQIFFPLAGTPSIEKAAYQAIRRSPEGTTGLRNVTIQTYYGIPLAELCFKVIGTPVRE